MSLDGPENGLEGTNRVILLDRDGVLNVDRADSVTSLDELAIERGAVEGCRALRAAGFRLVVITNQSAVGRGLTSRGTLDAINAELDRRLGGPTGGLIDGWYVCPHAPEDGCRCRKPGTLLLEQAAADYGFVPTETWFVCDAVRDVEAALAFGVRPVLVRTGKGVAAAAAYPELPVFDDLADVARRLT